MHPPSDVTPERVEGGATSGRRSQPTCWRCSQKFPGDEQVRDDDDDDDSDDEDDVMVMII